MNNHVLAFCAPNIHHSIHTKQYSVPQQDLKAASQRAFYNILYVHCETEQFFHLASTTSHPPKMSVPPLPFRFLDLPPELRVMIYKRVLPYTSCFHFRSDAHMQVWDDLNKENLSLLAVNKQTRNEASAMIYADNHNTFNVTITDSDFKVTVAQWRQGRVRMRVLRQWQISTPKMEYWDGLRTAGKWHVTVQLSPYFLPGFHGPFFFFGWLDKTALTHLDVDISWRRYKNRERGRRDIYGWWVGRGAAKKLRLAAEGIRKGIGSNVVAGNWAQELEEMRED